MQAYQSTPDFYRDYIEHGWLKDQAAKVHKYISRWRGKNGKWYYSYKSKAQEKIAQIRQDKSGTRGAITDDYGKNKYSYWRGQPMSIINKENKKGYSTSRSGRQVKSVGNGGYVYDRNTSRGIAAGRKRAAKQILAAKKGAQNKRTRGKTGSNLTSRGYSGSQGSGESKRIRNTASRRTVRYPWGSNIHRWVDRKGNVITNKVQYTVRGDGKEQNPDYWEDRRRRAKKK